MYLYLKLANKLREQIQAGQLQPGDQIPTGRDLTETERMSFATVQKAIGLLVSEGWLISGKRGTFVVDPIPAYMVEQKIPAQILELRQQLADVIARVEVLEKAR